MSSDKHCCVPGCQESRDGDAPLHGFPNPDNDRERFNLWLHAIGGPVLGLDNQNIFKYRRVCRIHFEHKYLCRNKRLSKIAIPTLYLPGLTKTVQSHDLIIENTPAAPICNLSQPSSSATPAGPTKTVQSHDLTIENTPAAPICNPSQPSSSATPADGAIPVCEKEILLKKQVPKVVPQDLKRTVTKNNKYGSLNRAERDLHSKIVSAKRKIYKLKSKVKKQSAEIKAAKKMVSSSAVLDTLENSTSAAKLLMNIQWRENKKKEKGRRFTLEEKILSLSILKQSPKGYKFLRKIFILPAMQTVTKLIQRCNLKPGINKNIFKQMHKRAAKMKSADKVCSLLFDEISLKAHVSYNEKKDKITGVIDDGQRRLLEFADHAQVFMVRGLTRNYKQPVFYSFSASATKGPELAKQIKMVVTQLQQAGLEVVACICDQGSNNRQALKLLSNETRGICLRRGESPKDNRIIIN